MAAGRPPPRAEIDALILLVVRRTALAPDDELRERLERARLHDQRERELRLEVEALRAGQERMPDERRAAILARRERQLTAAEQDAEAARLALRKAVQWRPGTLETVSRISVTLHQAAAAVLGVPGG